MAQKEAAKELNELLAKAMEQPGVADVMRVYESIRGPADSARETINSLRPQWVYQTTNTSS
jgi:hypothetical protein